MNRLLIGVSLAEVALVVVAIVVLHSAGPTSGLIVLAVAMVASAATATAVIRRSGTAVRKGRPEARSGARSEA